jgi:microcystin-dependent protein
MFVDPTLGNITIFAGNFAPANYMLCQGQLLSINTYAALYAILGTIYGGDGMSTFGLPNLLDRTAIGAGRSTAGTTYVEGQTGGNNTVSLNSSNVPLHTHPQTSFSASFAVSNVNATQASPVGNVPAVIPSETDYNTGASTTMAISTYSSTTVPAGSGGPVTITSPYLAMNYIIAVYGIFPSRN